ncbi:unnamed protein product, partial [Meganyctiphanes norvegica]
DYMERSLAQMYYTNEDAAYNLMVFQNSTELPTFNKMPQPRADPFLPPESQGDNVADPEELFSQRRRLLKKGCDEMQKTRRNNHWVYVEMHPPLKALDRYKKYFYCRNQKVGSTSWKAYAKVLKKSDVYSESEYRVNVLPVRHPFDRLKSAYTDKFLNGLPISNYNEAYKNSTASTESWMTRWDAYWLPVLISSGQVKEKNKLFKEKISVRRFIGKKYEDQNKNLIKKFSKASFSFLEFLNHVIWSYEHDLADRHWAAQYDVCKVCSNDYKYIIKLETSDEEIPYVIKQLNYTTVPSYGHKHKTTKKDKYSYQEYFTAIPNTIKK